jgi:putative ABC transport system substrate-binding protein
MMIAKSFRCPLTKPREFDILVCAVPAIRMQFDQPNRREFNSLLGGAAAAHWSGVAVAQISPRRPVIAVLIGGSLDYASALTQRIQELGYVAGRNVEIVYRYAHGDVARLPVLVDEVVRLNPDIVVVTNTQAAIAMKQATSAIPIIAANLTDPIGFGLVASHARPGGNVTGILASLDTLPEKQLALAAEVIPGAVKIGILINAGFRPHAIHRKGAEAAAVALAIKLVPVEVRRADDLDTAFQSLERERVDGVLVLQDPLSLSERRRIAMLAIAGRLPTMFGFREHVEAGGLMSYGLDLRTNFRRAADFVDKILKGAKPADLPVELATKFELVINLNTAKLIGLEFPPIMLTRADEVIE